MDLTHVFLIGLAVVLAFFGLIAGLIIRSLFARKSRETNRKNSVADSIAFLAAESKRLKDQAKAERVNKAVMRAVDLAVAEADTPTPPAGGPASPASASAAPAAPSPVFPPPPPAGVAATY